MSNVELLPIAIADVAPTTRLASALLALNNEHEAELSWLAPERLPHLVRQAFCARRVGQIDAFLLAFDQDADYGSPNFLWFRERYPRFVYVDRIVVAARSRGRGLARLLYRDLFAEAVRPAMFALCARSIHNRPIQRRTRFTRRWALSKSEPPPSMAATRRCAIC